MVCRRHHVIRFCGACRCSTASSLIRQRPSMINVCTTRGSRDCRRQRQHCARRRGDTAAGWKLREPVDREGPQQTGSLQTSRLQVSNAGAVCLMQHLTASASMRRFKRLADMLKAVANALAARPRIESHQPREQTSCPAKLEARRYSRAEGLRVLFGGGLIELATQLSIAGSVIGAQCQGES